MKTPKLVTATLFSGVAVTLAACGAGSSSHVVARVTLHDGSGVDVVHDGGPAAR